MNAEHNPAHSALYCIYDIQYVQVKKKWLTFCITGEQLDNGQVCGGQDDAGAGGAGQPLPAGHTLVRRGGGYEHPHLTKNTSHYQYFLENQEQC